MYNCQCFLALQLITLLMDVFSLHALFSRFRPRDGTPENCFFQTRA